MNRKQDAVVCLIPVREKMDAQVRAIPGLDGFKEGAQNKSDRLLRIFLHHLLRLGNHLFGTNE